MTYEHLLLIVVFITYRDVSSLSNSPNIVVETVTEIRIKHVIENTRYTLQAMGLLRQNPIIFIDFSILTDNNKNRFYIVKNHQSYRNFALLF
jgi:hypothetical protein